MSSHIATQEVTIAQFIGELAPQIQALFTQVLLSCDAQRLIGRHMFAIDAVKLPIKASPERSGSFAEWVHEASRMERIVKKMLLTHQRRDAASADEYEMGLNTQGMGHLQNEAKRVRDFLALPRIRPHPHPQRPGARPSHRMDVSGPGALWAHLAGAPLWGTQTHACPCVRAC
jgi:hypothetical protein